ALDQAMREPGVAGGTATFAAAPPVVAAAEELPPEEDRERNWWLWALLVAAILIGLLVGWALTRDTNTPVPDVTGESRSAAVQRLERNGFSVDDIVYVKRQTAPNVVLEQDPAASPPAHQAALDCSFLSFFCSKPGVTLTVSEGPASVKVPATAGLTREEAKEKLEAAGFEVNVAGVNSSSVEEGQVVYSQPGAGSTAAEGSQVTIFVSRGPKLAKVPVLVGSKRRVAVEAIRGAGLVPSVSEEENSAPAGEVIRQSPSAGTEAEPGSSVSIVVSSGEEEEVAKVPNVIGQERREAVEAIRAAGLQPAVEEEETEVPGQIGRVIDQFPPPGQELEPGSTVTITVGKRAVEEFEEEGEAEP
ncbi:MAG TPA: PASTA domain-containing protein, partial [Solirubrobacterales bacterium]|nr:PASTA domain-containing protein [Solirubrobacterales bacterium]